MSVQVFDKALELVAPGTALTANGSATGVLLYPRQLLPCDWVIYVSAVLGTGTYTFNLQVSDVVGGTYTTIASVVWPPAVAAGRIHTPVSGQMAAFQDSDSKFIRINYVIGATSSVVLGSFLAKAASNAGLAYRIGDFVTVS
jgi:hypothetical protein